MPTLEALKRRIKSTEDLQSVVKTMKALAAVNIRQYEKAVAALGDYARTVEMGLHVVLRSRPDLPMGARSGPENRLGAVIFGSDQGMCGQLNEQVVSHAVRTMEEHAVQDRTILAVGERVTARLEDEGLPVGAYFSVPNSLGNITQKVRDILVKIEQWHEARGLDQIFLFYCRQISEASYEPHTVHLLPVDDRWLRRLRSSSWPTHALPLFTMDWNSLFSAFIRQYLFVSLFRAFAESLASENASRLASMQGAERNIEDQLAGLNIQYHQQRQMSITEELLDIVSGFEALKESS